LALYETEQWEQLMTLSRRIQRLRPGDYWINHFLAFRFVEKKPPQWEDAGRFYTAALALRPENPAIQNDLAWFLVTWPRAEPRHFEEAIELAKKAVKSTPTAAIYWSTLGIAHSRATHWSEALAAFQEAAKLRGDGNSFDQFHLAMVHFRLGDKQQARSSYDQGVEWMEKNDPDNGELTQMRSAAAQLLGIKDSTPAETRLKQFIRRALSQ
jgi:tetratricopeptide (TPR) repeat protein